MGRYKKAQAHQKRSNNNTKWILAGLAGAVMMIVAALALASRQDNSTLSGQKPFDPNFEPEISGAPRVEVLPQDVVDYGDVKLGSTINTVFNVRNVGDKPLVVLGEPQVELVEGC